jgi:FkbM family methyltransferase
MKTSKNLSKNKDEVYAHDILLDVLSKEKEESKETYFSQLDSFRSRAIHKLSRIKTLSLLLSRLFQSKIIQNIVFLLAAPNGYRVSSWEKINALEFLEYVLSHNPRISYSLFPKKDHKEIKKFVENKFLLSIFDNINPDKLFNARHWQRQKYYQVLKKTHSIRTNKNYFEYNGFKSIRNDFDPSIFIEHYGIQSLSNRKRLNNGVIIDCGAYIGDSAYLFHKKLSSKTILAIEPDPVNFQTLLKNIRLNHLNNVIAIHKGISRSKGTLSLVLSGTAGAHFNSSKEKGKVRVEVKTIDDIISSLKLNNVSFIKMDIEGNELSALQGAQKTLVKFHPSLIISLYHKGRDFFEIPIFLKKTVDDYRFRFINLNASNPILERVLIAET